MSRPSNYLPADRVWRRVSRRRGRPARVFEFIRSSAGIVVYHELSLPRSDVFQLLVVFLLAAVGAATVAGWLGDCIVFLARHL